MDTFQQYLRITNGNWDKVYCLKLDVKKYFPSIDRDILFGLIQRKIKDKDALWLIKTTLDHNPSDNGLGVGALTSQLFANVYLNQLDHYAKEELRIKYYIRYMDDVVILGDNKQDLHRTRKEIEDFLWYELRLETNSKTQVLPVNRGITFLGYRVWPTHRLLKGQSKRRAKRRLKNYMKLYKKGEIELEEINQSIMSWLGHVKHCDSYYLRKAMFRNFVLTRNISSKNE